MSTQVNSPIRVADLSGSVYVPRMPNRATPATSSTVVEPPSIDQASAVETLSELSAELLPLESAYGLDIPNLERRAEERSGSAIKIPDAVRVWGVDYGAVTMPEAVDYLDRVIAARKPAYAITANLNYAMLCEKHPRLQKFTERAALVLCDGMPILWRSKLAKTPLPERVAGSDLIYSLSQRCSEKGYRVYFYGAAQGVAEATAARLKQLYPQLVIAGVQCPPFHDSSSAQIQSQIAMIKQAKPDLLFVALGQPKGEYWIEDHLSNLRVPLCIQLGASFDFVAGKALRAPKWMQKTGLEWLYRACKDPKRLFPRYWGNFVFLVRSIRRELIDGLS